MTTIFSTNNVSKRKLKNLSKRTLGMESLETREMLDNAGIDNPAPEQPDSVQTDAVPAASQDFHAETDGDITSFQADTSSLTAVAFVAGVEGSSVSGDYSIYYTICSSSTFDGTGTWTIVPSSTVSVSGGTVSFSGVTFDATTLVTSNSGKYVFFGVAKGNAATIAGGFDTSGVTDKVADVDYILLGAPTYSDDALTDSVVTVSGATTDQVTLTWGKPTKYVDSGDTNDGWKAALPSGAKYSINVFQANGAFVKTIDAGTKTTYNITGLPAAATDTGYKFTVTTNLTLTNPSDRSASAVTKTGVIIAAGKFTTLAKGAAADVSVGPPTSVKTVYTAKTTSVKVTWSAPVNYTGGYTVTLHDVADTATTNDIKKTINPGEKLEFTVSVGTTAGTNVFDTHRYKVIVDTTAANGRESTPTYVNVGTVTATAVAPAVPAAPATAALATPAPSAIPIPGGTVVTLAPNATPTANPTVGFYVGVAATSALPAKNTVTFADLVYVPKAAAGATTVNLKVKSSDFVYAFAVGADGTISDTGAISTSAAAITTDVVATDAAKVYPPANDVKNVTATADTTTKNKYTVKWAAATDFLSPNVNETSKLPTTTADFKYEVTGYRITATIKNGSTAGPSEVQYVAKGTNEVIFTNLRWSTKYDFKVEALVTYTTTTDGSAWAAGSAAVSAGASKAGVAVATAPTVADAITVAEKSGTNTGINDTVTISNATAGTSYIVTITDVNNNKAVLGTKTVLATAASEDILLDSVVGANLTPKAKYTVTVQTVGSVPGTVSKGKPVTITAADFVSATLKDAKGTKITEVKITVTAPKVAGDGKYYIEYTNVVDAKSKPDWNAAKVYTGTTTDPAAVAGGDSVTIGKLNPNSSYFFRVVTVDKTYVASTGEWITMTKVATSSALKITTAAVPLPTIVKPSLAVTAGYDLTLNFTGKSIEQVNDGSKNPIGLGTTPKIVYSVLVSANSTVDKATGKLLGATEVAMKKSTDNDGFTGSSAAGIASVSTGGKYNDNLKLSTDGLEALVLNGENGLFSELGGNANNLKTLNIQLVATITSDLTGTGGAVVYSRAAKITLPKWFA